MAMRPASAHVARSHPGAPTSRADSAELLSRVGLAADAFDHADNRIPFAAADALLGECVATTGCPHFGLLAGQRQFGVQGTPWGPAIGWSVLVAIGFYVFSATWAARETDLLARAHSAARAERQSALRAARIQPRGLTSPAPTNGPQSA